MPFLSVVQESVAHFTRTGNFITSVMKDKAEAVKAGLVLYGSPDKIKAHCLTCHANAHETAFDFDASWGKIKHPIPKG